MNALNGQSEAQLEATINKIIDERVDLILMSLSVYYEPKPLVDKFDANTKSFDIDNAYCMSRMSDLSYKDIKLCRGELDRCSKSYTLKFSESTDGDIACYVVVLDNSIIVSFRGTETRNINRQINNIITDTNIVKTDFYRHGKVHKGFKNAIDSLWEDIYRILKENYNGRSIWLTGHSLGGALAVLAGGMLLESDIKDKIAMPYIYTIGQPKIGNAAFSDWIEKSFEGRYYRVTQGHDPVVMVPILFGYRHAGTLVYLNEDGTFEVNDSENGLAKRQFKKIRNYFSMTSLKLVAFRVLPFHIDLSYSSLFSDHSMVKYLINLKEIIATRNG